MGSSLYTVTVDAKDPRKLAEFWEQVLDYKRIEETAPDADEIEVCIAPKDGNGNEILFVEDHEEKVMKNRIHFDLNPTDQAAEVDRVLALGATKVDIGQTDVTWVVLADPEGNEFCILRAR